METILTIGCWKEWKNVAGIFRDKENFGENKLERERDKF